MTEETQEAISNVPPPPTYTADDIHRIDSPSKITMIPVEDISLEEALQVRRYKVSPAKVEELAKDIVTRGQIQPVLVRKHPTGKGKYAIIAGATRAQAIAHINANKMMNGAGPLQVAAQVVEMSDLEAFAAGVAENMKRNDMSPVDHAHIIGVMMGEYGMSKTEIGKVVGKTLSWVSEHASILTLRPAIQKKIHAGLPYTIVRELKDMTEEDQDNYLVGLEAKTETRDSAKAKAKAKKSGKAKESEPSAKGNLTMKEARTILENLGGIGVDAEEAAAKGKDYECKYSVRVQGVALALIKALDGKLGEKALANKIDAA